MFLHEYIKQVAKDKLEGDLSRFDELWRLIPDFAQTLRTFDSDSEWLHWRKKTYDGWYCIQTSEGTFEVYHQERGTKEPGTAFTDERDAILFALKAAGLKLDDTRRLPW